LIGSDRSTLKTRSRLLSRMRQSVHYYIGIDGGAGANLLADLAGRNPYLQQVSSPRQADLLILVEPISQKLAPAVVTLAKALAHPAHVLIVGGSPTERPAFPEGNFALLDALFPGAHHAPATSIEQVLRSALSSQQWAEMSINETLGQEETTIQLPAKQDQEMATELAVLSLGPLQAWTAGPLRLFLICDGEQVFSVQMETEYAYRGIDSAMMQSNWQQGLRLARHVDPLAPLAGQLAYVRALEELQGWQPSAQLETYRELALALERTQNTLWWLVRFARLIDDAPLAERSYRCVRDLAEGVSSLWQMHPSEWMLPQYVPTNIVGSQNAATIAQLRQVANMLPHVQHYVEQNRGLALRIRGIGTLPTHSLRDKGIGSGPVYAASEHGTGDVQSRLITRLQAAVNDVQQAVETITTQIPAGLHLQQDPRWDVLEGEARVTVEGPRGTLGLSLVSQGGEESQGPTRVEWQRPSASLLTLLPELLVGQKLADAEVILASLDLAMAEVDG